MLDVIFEPAFWASVVLLVGMEVALSADNVVSTSAMASRIPEEHRQRVLLIGIVLAAVFRLVLLGGLVWVLGLERTAFAVGGWSSSWRELILLAGGAFLIYKAVTELYRLVELRTGIAEQQDFSASESASIAILQIVLASAVFSVDSILTAIGLTPYVVAMVAAVVISVAILYFAAERIADLVARHPAIKAVALGFLLLVGVVLFADGLGLELARSYLYGPMALAVFVLAVIMLVRHFSSREQPRAVAPAVPVERSEPVLEPAPVGAVDPVVTPQEATEPVVEPEPSAAPEPVIIVPAPAEPVSDSAPPPDSAIDEPGEHEVPDYDDETLGEADRRVPKSRPKRALMPRRPVRRRTGKRRE